MISVDPKSMNLASTSLPRLGIVVSTAWRRSSACVNSPPWYFETLAFKGDRVIEQSGGAGDARSALADHCALCERLLGEYDYAQFERSDEGLYVTLKPIGDEKGE